MTQNNHNKISIRVVSKQVFMDLFQNAGRLIGIFGPFIALLTIVMGCFTYAIFNVAANSDTISSVSLNFIPVGVLFLMTIIYGCKACCDCISYFANKGALVDGYSPFKIDIYNFGFIVHAIILQFHVIVLAIVLMGGLAGTSFFLASTFNMNVNIKLTSFNVTGSNTTNVYVVMGLMGGLLVLVYAIIVNFILNRVFKLPASALGLDLKTDGSTAMVNGYKIKLFITMVVTWIIPFVLISLGHSYFFNFLDHFNNTVWLTAFIFALKHASYAFIYALLSLAVPMIILKKFFKHAYENSSDELTASFL